MREQAIHLIEQERIIAIVRGIEADKCLQVADALYVGGIRLMEVTFNQKEPESFSVTSNAIAEISGKYKDSMLVGAGTVTTVEQAELAAQAGARFIISPNVNTDVIRRTLELGMVSMPGAMTPTEILTAHLAGADFVKIFPVHELGISYIKAVRAPISHVKLMAVGGVNEGNVADFLNAGMCGAGVGGNLANRSWIEAGEFDKITQTARALLSAARTAQAS